MTIFRNFWVQKRYQRVVDNQWMLFVWGFPEISMLNALEKAANKPHTKLRILEESPEYWQATDPESDTRYIVEMRNTKPEIVDSDNISIRDQTLPIKPDRKQMPVPGTLFQPNLF